MERASFSIGLGTSILVHAGAIAFALYGGQIFVADPAFNGPVVSVAILSVPEYGALISDVPTGETVDSGSLPAPEQSLESAAEQTVGPAEPRGSPTLAGLPDAPSPPSGHEPPEWTQSWPNPVEEAPDSPSSARTPLRPAAEPTVPEAEAARPSEAAPGTPIGTEAPSPLDPLFASPPESEREPDAVAVERPSVRPTLAAALPSSDSVSAAGPSPLASRAERPSGPDFGPRDEPEPDPISSPELPPPDSAAGPEVTSVPSMPLPPPVDSQPDAAERQGVDVAAHSLPTPLDVSPHADSEPEGADVALLGTDAPTSPATTRQAVVVSPLSQELDREKSEASVQPPPEDVSSPGGAVQEEVDSVLSATVVPPPVLTERREVDAETSQEPPPSGVSSPEDIRQEVSDGALLAAASPVPVDTERQGVDVSPPDEEPEGEGGDLAAELPSPGASQPDNSGRQVFDEALLAAAAPATADTERQGVVVAQPDEESEGDGDDVAAEPPSPGESQPDDFGREVFDGALSAAAAPVPVDTERQGVDVSPPDEEPEGEGGDVAAELPSPGASQPDNSGRQVFDEALLAAAAPATADTERQGVDVAQPDEESEGDGDDVAAEPPSPGESQPDDFGREVFDGALSAAAAPVPVDTERQGVDVSPPDEEPEGEGGDVAAELPSPGASQPDNSGRQVFDEALLAAAAPATADTERQGVDVAQPDEESEGDGDDVAAEPPSPGESQPDDFGREVFDGALSAAAAPVPVDTERQGVDVSPPDEEPEGEGGDVAAELPSPGASQPDNSGRQVFDEALLAAAAPATADTERQGVDVAASAEEAETEGEDLAVLPPPLAGEFLPDDPLLQASNAVLSTAAAPVPLDTDRQGIDLAAPSTEVEPEDAGVAVLPPSTPGFPSAEGQGLQGGDLALLPPSVSLPDNPERPEIQVVPPPPPPEQTAPEDIEVAVLPPPPRNLPDTSADDVEDESESTSVRTAPPAPRPSGQAEEFGGPAGAGAPLDFLGEAVEDLPRDGRAGFPFAGSGPPLSGTEQSYLIDRISRCWHVLPLVGQAGAKDVVVTIRVVLTLDGNVDGEPALVDPNPLPSGNRAYRFAFDAARSAVKGCAPYDKLPREKYQRWRNIEISFNPEGMVAQ